MMAATLIAALYEGVQSFAVEPGAGGTPSRDAVRRAGLAEGERGMSDDIGLCRS